MPESLQGECSRLLIEVRSGVFIGSLSTRVREKLWELVKQHSETGAAFIVYDFSNEQGFLMEMHGDPKRTIIDIDELQMVRIK